MKLYYAPGACSLADRIALNEAGIAFDGIKVDLKAKRTEGGDDYAEINPKGYVPALRLDDGQMLTENIAILSWIAAQRDRAAAEPSLAQFRRLETLAFISTELHKNFKPFFAGGSEDDKRAAGETIGKRLNLIAGQMKGDYLFGAEESEADGYLFVMLLWARKNSLAIPQRLAEFMERMGARPAVKRSLAEEGLA